MGDDEVVVLTIERVEEPHFAGANRAGERDARRPLVEGNAVLVLQRGNEIGGDDVELVVADAGVQAENAAGSFAVFRRLAAGFDFDGAEAVSADADEQEAVGGLSYVEAIEQSERLISLRTGNVGLSGGVLHHARNEIQHLAVVISCRVRDVDYVEAGDLFLGRDLGGVDGRRRFAYVYYRPHFAEMG